MIIHDEHGMSLVEILVVLALIGLVVGAYSLYLRPVEAALETASAHVEGTLRAARLKAIATTSAYRVRPQDDGRLVAEWAGSCSAASWTDDDGLDLDLPADVRLDSTAWTVCFTSRGVSNANVVITLNHPQHGTRHIEVLLGGTTRVFQ